jgi:TolB-like protein
LKGNGLICCLVVPAVMFFHNWMSGCQVFAGDQKQVIVLPFQINAETDRQYLQKGISGILESRIAGMKDVVVVSSESVAGYEGLTKHTFRPEEIRGVGKKQDIDYTVYGSLTIIGKNASLDVRVLKTSENQKPWYFFRKIDTMDDLIPATEDIAGEIEKTLFSSATQGKVVPSSTIADDIHLQKHKKKSHRRQSRNLPIQIIGLGSGDINGDGNTEIVAASNHDLHIIRLQENDLISKGEIKGEGYYKYLSIDVADINQNGIAEIYISCEHSVSGSLASFVVEWNGTYFSPIIQDQNWYFRVIRTKNGNQLLGQKKGISEAYISDIFELFWKNSSIMIGKELLLPDDIMVFGVSKGFTGENKDLVAAFDPNDKLCMINASGSVAWKSNIPYGGKESFVKTVAQHRKNTGDRFYMPQRTFSLDFEKIHTVIIPFNESSSGRMFQKFRNFHTARFISLTWDGNGLSVNRKSKELSGYVSDFLIADLNNDGLEELTYAIVKERESAFRNPQSYITSVELSDFFVNRQ